MKKLAFAFLLPFTALADNEVGFIERFALAADREKALGELVPGSEEYYFFHALHYQNERADAKLAEILEQWRKRTPGENEARRMIQNREALTNYDRDPQGTLKYLIERLDIRFDHEAQVRDQKPNLPTVLDPATISREAFIKEALKDPNALPNLPEEALRVLIGEQVPLSALQRRAALSQMERPDVPHLVEAILMDLRVDKSRGFGDLTIHRNLLPEQLDELAKVYPNWLSQQAFVYTRLRRLGPSADVDIRFDTEEREAWLERVWAYAEKLPPSHNTLKSRILYLRLDHDRKKGVYNRAQFIEYLKLPRQMGYVNPAWMKTINGGLVCDLNVDLSEPLIDAPPVGNDEALVREYFHHLMGAEAKVDSNPQSLLLPWIAWVKDTWLKPVLAEALITQGIGQAEQWASLLSPTAFQELKDRVDIEFPATNAESFLPGDDIQFEVVVKNTPKLIVKIYELNTLNFFQQQNRQLNTDLNLDGLVANSEQTHGFEAGPFVRTRQTFQFPELKGKRGAWIIEFIGGGRSSRALIRTGQWKALQQTGPSGDLILVLDEKNQPVKEAVVWFEGRKLVRDEKLDRIVVPFTANPGTKPLLIGDAAGTFATLTSFEHHSEDYRMEAQFHIEREQLLAGREATLAVRVNLNLHEAHLAPELLEDPKLTITSVTHEGIEATQEVSGLELSAGSVLTHTFQVPARVRLVKARLTASVAVVSEGGVQRELSAEENWEINGIDAHAETQDVHLSQFGDQWVIEVLGKNGEPRPDVVVPVGFRHREWDVELRQDLRTDERGRLELGELGGIQSVWVVRKGAGEDLVRNYWTLSEVAGPRGATVYAREGEAIRIAYGGTDAAQVSLLEGTDAPPQYSSNQPILPRPMRWNYVADRSTEVKWEAGYLVIEGLEAGDYSLTGQDGLDTTIEVTAGEMVAGWAMGEHRQLQLKGNASVHIAAVETDVDFVTVRLSNSGPFARVHVTASRFMNDWTLDGTLGGFSRWGASSGVPDRLPNLYSMGREIGDEYRYILERRYAKRYPGNMLTRPGLLLNPWEVRDTELNVLDARSGGVAGSTRGGAMGKRQAGQVDNFATATRSFSGVDPGTNLDFLATSAPAIYNLVPDKEGVVRIDRKALGDRQQVQIYAEDLESSSWRRVALPEVPTKLADQRLMRNLEPDKSFAERKDITVLAKGEKLTLRDVLTSEMEIYDTLGSVHSLFTTLTGNADLAKFAWVLGWPQMAEAEKRAKYGEVACHELNFFLFKKDPAFFEAVVKPYLANKKDKTFMDEFLLGAELVKYLDSWAYAQLNIAERILLGQRIVAEAPQAARHVRELWEMIPPNPAAADYLFETALRGRAMEKGREGASVAEALENQRQNAEATAALMEKMNRIVLPTVQFDGVTIEEAVAFLRQASREQDQEKKGVNFILKTGDEPVLANISLQLTEVPLAEALRYVTELAGMKYRVEGNAVLILAITEVTNEMVQRVFEVPQFLRQFFAASGDAADVLKEQGIIFPNGSSVVYDTRHSELVVRNTVPNLELVEAYLMSGMANPILPPADVPMAAADPFSAPDEHSNSALITREAMSRTVEELGDVMASPAAEPELLALGLERQRALGRKMVESDADDANSNSYFGYAMAGEAQAQVRPFFRAVGSTKEWAENNYYQLRIEDQGASLVTVNAFWRDYAKWVAAGSQGGFVSGAVAEAGQNFTSMMLALAVLDLPFEAPTHETADVDGAFVLTSGGPCVVYHKEIQPNPDAGDEGGALLVSQSFFRVDDRYRQVGNEQVEKSVTGEFLTGVAYGASVVVTNPNSRQMTGSVLWQIPQGALPVAGSRATVSESVQLAAYTTQTFEHFFYFPVVPEGAGAKFAHYPVTVTADGVGSAAVVFAFNVVSKLTEVDKASWEYVSQEGSEEEVFAYLGQTNLNTISLERVAWRCRASAAFYTKLMAFMREHHVMEPTVLRYALMHNDAATLREWLKVWKPVALGPYFSSELVTLDAIERRSYEHLEYSPLVNQRAHRLGGEWRIANPAVLGQYQALLMVLVHKPELEAMDHLSVAYYLFLQDRVEEALERMKAVDAAQLPTRLQFDYLTCYAAFYEGDLAAARGLAAKHANHAVPRWKKLFAEVMAQLKEIDGAMAEMEKAEPEDREKQQANLTATEPSFDFKVEDKKLVLNWQNLLEVTVHYYLMDPEFAFSSSPFVSQDAGRFSIIMPNQTQVQALPKGKATMSLPLPAEYAQANVLVEVIGAGQRRTQAYHANTMRLTMTENYGRLEVRDAVTGKPLPKTYVKVYVRLASGTVRFFKDGYTDLRGRFDYASLNAPEGAGDSAGYEAPPANGLDHAMLKPTELGQLERLSVLVLSDANGAAVREVGAPGR